MRHVRRVFAVGLLDITPEQGRQITAARKPFAREKERCVAGAIILHGFDAHHLIKSSAKSAGSSAKKMGISTRSKPFTASAIATRRIEARHRRAFC